MSRPLRYAFVALWLLPCAYAPAEENCDVERARQSFDQALEHFQASQWTEALARFQEANEECPSAQILVNIGDCQERLGRPLLALEVYERFLDDPGAGPERLRGHVEERIRALSEKVGRLAVEAPDGTRVRTEDRDLGVTPLDPVRLEVGTHRISLSPPGRADMEMDVDVVGGQTATLRLPAEPPPARPKTPTLRIAALSTLGLGVAATGVGVVFGFIAANKATELEGAETPEGSRDYAGDGVNIERDGERAEKVQIAGLVVGGVALAAGAVMLWWDLPDGRRPSSAAPQPLAFRF